ncbi:unnamed protein product [Spodoptera exigua]|nr:unnamed protein product [Spodoptera exigua]
MSEEGSEDSPPRPKRKIKKVMVLSSDSSSDSDESVAGTGSRRKRLRVLSDEGSDSSGSSVVCAGARRKRTLPKLRDSDGDSDTSGWATDHSDAPKPTTAVKPISGFASDSSEGNSDKCSICLMRFTNQEVGTPQNCEHIFCLDCITEWSRNVNTCPVDRMNFDFIVVRACAGGRVLRTEPVKVVERRPSVDLLVIEDPTICEVCGRTDNEETMLLCDGCDLGYHMQCLTPPLSEVPAEQWLCPNCDNLLTDVDYLFSSIRDVDVPSRSSALVREGRVVRSSRSHRASDEPSTSSGHSGSQLNFDDIPTTSRGTSSRSANSTTSRTSTARHKTTAHTNRRKPKKRRTKTVIIEYEVQENGKFPVTKRVKRKLKKRKSKRRQPRTAARRSHVLASVRAKLAGAGLSRQGAAVARPGLASAGDLQLSTSRQRAGIPALSIFGNPHEIEYFSEEDEGVSESASTAVAARPTSNILSAYRQARRKMISIPSPPHASSAPDVLSSILESQTLLHSKKSVVSISVDGSVNIKLETREKIPKKMSDEPKENNKVDITRGEDAAKKVPSYPGQSRGGRGWGGGYTGNYHREQGSSNLNNRGGNYDNNYSSGGYQNRQGNAFNQNNGRRDDQDAYNNYSRRVHQYPQGDELQFDRNRRQPPEQNRGQNNQQRHNEQNRYSLAPSWQPYVPPPVGPRNDPPIQHRHSFGGFENPLDMRMGPIRRQNSANNTPALNESQSVQHQATKPQAQPYRPLPEPPVFSFNKTADLDKSEDEKSDSSLVIDTEKYDPTEPTNDDDSGDDDTATPAATEPQPSAAPPAPSPPSVAGLGGDALGVLGGDALGVLGGDTLGVPHGVLDSAVRQVLQEHRDLLAPAAPAPPSASDDDDEGDCPNFSIYSATSVHIANNTADLPSDPPPAPASLHDNLEDLVQEDDEAPDPPDLVEADTRTQLESSQQSTRTETVSARYTADSISKRKSEEELKEKVSKRCPITTNPRNPIKIKLNTPSLIKRQVSLYDEDLEDEEEVIEEKEAAGSVEPDVEARDKRASSERGSPLCDEQLSSEPVLDAQLSTSTDVKDKDPDAALVESRKNSAETDEQVTSDIEADQAPPAVPAADQPGEGEDTPGSGTPPRRCSSPDLSASDTELPLLDQSPRKGSVDRTDDLIEKMTESISETEDERSYTPCLDENKSKDTSLETEKEKGIEGLDTEMISEDEGNGLFSDNERAPSEQSRGSPAKLPANENEEGEIIDKKKEARADDGKKKKKKESKKESKDKTKTKGKKGEVAFKKLSKSGKERNYRDKDKKRERRDSSDGERERAKQRRKERRKDLERYDVRTVVSDKRRRPKDAFGRDVSPRARSPSPSRPSRASRSPRPIRASRSPRLPRASRSPRLPRASRSPRLRASRSPRPTRASRSPRAPRGSRSPRLSRSPRVSRSPPRLTPVRRGRMSVSPRSSGRAASPPRVSRRRRRSTEREKRVESRKRRSVERSRKRRRSVSGSKSPRSKPTKRKKRIRSERSASRRRSPRRRSPRRRRGRRRSASRSPEPSPAGSGGVAPAAGSGGAGSIDSQLLSPRTPPPEPEPVRARRRRDPARHRRARDAPGPSKEVFTSGDNILVSVSFKEQERAEDDERRSRRRSRRRRKRRATAPDSDAAAPRPVAIIDLERSPFRELTPSPRNVIVLSDSEPGEKEAERAAGAGPPAPVEAVGPKTPPSPGRSAPEPAPEQGEAEEARGPNTPPEPPDSPDAYDPYEPTRSASGSPRSAPAASPARTCITLETAQKTNMSADDVIDRRPLSPIEKVMALLQSTRDVSPEPPPSETTAPPAPAPVETVTPAAAAAPGPLGAPATAAPAAPAPAPPVRIVLPSPTRSQPPKLFLAKPSPIKSDPIKPMQATKIQRPAALGPSTAAVAARRRDGPESDGDADSPYSPGSSDFGDLFEPPAGARGGFDALLERPRRKRPGAAAKVPVKLSRKKGKTQVGVKIDEDNLKILDDLPSSAVEMQVKSKFLKKLNRQERVVEEVKLVLKPHYNKKHVTKDEYKDILRRAVPKICHNKTGEINPAKIQALVEAYVKKFRKKHKLGLV